MVQMMEFYFDSANTFSRIHCIKWLPDTPPVAVLQLAHGVGDYIDRYDEFARFMAENGFVVVGNSHAGHGRSAKSEDDLGFFAENDGWNVPVEDMRSLHKLTSGEYPDLPYFLLGHSMGSFLARTYIAKYPNGLSGCIISGTAQMPAIVCSFGRLMAGFEAKRIGLRGRSKLLDKLCFGSYNARISPKRTAFDWISRDNEIVDKYVADPCCGFVSSTALISDMMGGLKFIGNRKNLVSMNKTMPVLFISGEADPVGGYGKGVKKAYEAFLSLGCSDVSLKLYPGGRHEMLNEINRGQVYEDILIWLRSKLQNG